MRLQNEITRPIGKLAWVDKMISIEGDYSIRAVKESDAELGHFLDGFYQLLAQIDLIAGELQDAHAKLERRVAERTSELQSEVTDRINSVASLVVRYAYLNALFETAPLGIVVM